MKIARTETVRFLNQSKLLAFKESGVVKEKKWHTFIDARTCDICKSLNGQIVGLHDTFIDERTGKEYFQPSEPHSHCRCTLTAVLK